jgi:hypothetical protein
MSVRPTIHVNGTQKSQSAFDLIHVLKPETTTQKVGKVSEWITDNVSEFLRWIYRLRRRNLQLGGGRELFDEQKDDCVPAKFNLCSAKFTH